MAKVKGAVVIDKERCKGCGLCIVSCPNDVLGHSGDVNGRGYDYVKMVKPDDCIGCASCGTVCPDSVITVYRAKN